MRNILDLPEPLDHFDRMRLDLADACATCQRTFLALRPLLQDHPAALPPGFTLQFGSELRKLTRETEAVIAQINANNQREN